MKHAPLVTDKKNSLVILVVEDNKVGRKTIARLLQRKGIEVNTFSSAEDALEFIETEDPLYDVILTDIHMPRMSGIEFAKAVKILGNKTSTVPILALTADIRQGIVEECLSFGIEAVLTKPFSVNQLLEHISAVRSEQDSSA